MHIEKAKATQVVGFILHDLRSCENHTNEKIDSSRTNLNYNLVNGDPLENYRKRMDQVYMRKSKSANTLAMLSTTLPKDFPPELSREFFEECHKFYASKFGADNIISAAVHMDETTPHMHTKFIPVYYNEKRERDTVSFDKVVTRSVYRTIHKELQEHLIEHFNFHVAILTGATAGGNKTIQELKSDELEKEQAEIFLQMCENRKIIKEQEKTIALQEKKIEKLDEAIEHNREVIHKQEEKYNTLKKMFQELVDAIKPLERLKGMLELVRERAYEFRSALNKIDMRYDVSENEEKALRSFWNVIEGKSDVDKAIEYAERFERHKGHSKDDDLER